MKYKFNTGIKEPSEEKIAKHKDFKKLRANYDEAVKPLYKRPLYKDPKAFVVLLVIGLLTYILVEIFDKEHKDEEKKLPPIEQNK